MFPFYMRFHGGKGFAAYLGMTLALNWRFALLLLLAVSLITLVTDYVVLRDNDDRHQRPALQRMERQQDHRAAPPAPFGDHHL